MGVKKFELVSKFTPAGDQPKAIEFLIDGFKKGKNDQVLLGVTGSGKTFTMANVIQSLNVPTLIMAPNKTLASQLYSEMQEFFPNNAVEYFVSYYDYYQPEAYVPKTGTYIEKTASINEQIDRMRHSATRSLLSRRDVIVVASVSCIYGIGGPEIYGGMVVSLKKSQNISIFELSVQLAELQYKRNDMSFLRGTFRITGDTFDIFPSHSEDKAWRINFLGDKIESIVEIDSLTCEKFQYLESIKIFSNSHYVTPAETIKDAIVKIRIDLENRIEEFKEQGKLIEAQRIKERVNFDIEMMQAMGTCSGIENYSRYLNGRNAGDPPPTLFEYLPSESLLIVDESHVSVPQVGGMYLGDRARKTVLSEHGFRLPSCKDNRPLKFEEWYSMRPKTVYVSATPGIFELEKTDGVYAEQIIRPTGLIDPVCDVIPCDGQVDHLINECKKTIAMGFRVLVTTLTKKMAEALADYMSEADIKVRYLHSDVKTLERVEIIRGLRLGKFDVLIGINLLREGLDIPECALVAILDADKEGFLRSKTSLIQTIGRAARNAEGRVFMYADRITKSIQGALEETERRRYKQIEYNKEHGITPKTTFRSITEEEGRGNDDIKFESMKPKALERERKKMQKEMLVAAKTLDFEKAAKLRDQVKTINKILELSL